MPANLTPDYVAAEQRFREAKTAEDKVLALEEMLALIPKHKGTEKMQADIKRRLSKLREEGERKARAGRVDPFYVPKQGAGQVVLFGYPNVGKSSLVARLTSARVVVGDYPFSTVAPVSGMMPYEDVWVQLVDMPPVVPEDIAPGLMSALRLADGVLIVVDASADECLDQLASCLDIMRDRAVLKSDFHPGAHTAKDVSKCLVAATRLDRDESWKERLAIIREFVPAGLAVVPVSAQQGTNLEELRRALFDLLGVIRIYTKVPGREPDMTMPFVLKRGATVVDMARAVHRDFPDKLRSARVWGSARFGGQSVPREHVLSDRDVVELHV